MRVTLRRVAFALGVVTLACSSGDLTGPLSTVTPPTSTGTPASVTITPPTSATLSIGTSISLTAAVKTATGQDISGLAITWSSSDASVATVSATGVLTALKPGTTTITAFSSGKSASIDITVVPVQVKSVLISVKTTFQPTEQAQATATPLDGAGTPIQGRGVTWTTSNPIVAVVSSSGLVTAVSAGSADITASIDGVLSTTTVTVLPPPIFNIVVTVPTTSLQVGASTTAAATAKDASGNQLTGRPLAWTSSNPSVATVSASGVITGVSLGSATITASGEGQTGSVTISVSLAPVASITLQWGGQFFIGQSATVGVTMLDAAGAVVTGRPITYTSSNPTIATVDAQGVVKALAVGSTLITAASGGVTGSVGVTVMTMPGVASVTLAANNTTLQPTQTSLVSAVIRDAQNNIINGGVTWASSNTAVATVSSNGLVTARGPGSANITGTNGAAVGTLSFTVPNVTAINVSAAVSTLQPTQSTQAAFTLTGSNGQPAINRVTAFTSSNPAVASVSSSGYIVANGPGSANITVTSEGVSGSLVVSVPPVATATVTAAVTTLQPTQASQANVTLLDANGNPTLYRTVTWTSSNPTAVSVNGAGTLNGVASGTAVITATSEGKSGTVTVTVPPVATITVTAPSTVRQPGQNTQASFTILDANGQPCLNRGFTWSSVNTTVATVNSSGLITPVGPGTTQINVVSEGVTGSLTFTVPPVATVNVTAPFTSLNVGGAVQAAASLLDANNQPATNRVITWSSGSPAIATVSSSGSVTGVSAGTAVITATSEGKTGSISITVTGSGTGAVGSIAVSSPASNLMQGQTAQLTATVLDPSGNPAGIAPTWTSSDPTKGTITAGGLVTNVNMSSQGSVTFTASAGGISRTTTVSMVGHPNETYAALPQIFLNTTAPVAPAAGGQVINVNTSAQLQAALNSAQGGDVIALANGVTFIGNFILPAKPTSNTKWIVIQPQDVSMLPPEGQRMTPTIAAAANLPKVVSPTNNGAFATVNNAHHFRLVGLEVTSTANNTGLVRFGDSSPGVQGSLSVVPNDFIADRMYIHGGTGYSARRCVSLNSSYSAVIDSYLSSCVELGSDAQAIWGANGPGPFKITNNYLEGSGENVMFGGADPMTNLVPSDIEVRGNHFFKPISWHGQYSIKNLFESKNSMRMLVEGNIFEGNWLDAQTGTAISIKVANQNGACTWCTTQDLTFRYNIIRNVGAGFVLSGSDPGITVHAQRVTVTDNLVYNINIPNYLGIGRGFTVSDDPTDFTVAHNTVMNPDQYAINFAGPLPPPVRFVFRDNIVGGGQYGVKGTGTGGGTATLQAFMTVGGFGANVIQYYTSANYPANSFYPNSMSSVGFLDAANFDFHLAPSGPYRGKGTDGRDPGADIDAIMLKTANVIVP